MLDRTQANQGESLSVRAIPEPGQLVEVRRRQWVVSDVQGSALGSGANKEQHLVTLSSLDEDALGEELTVVWQIEPGARVLEKAGLPRITGCDSHERYTAFMDAVRWGAVTNADRSFLQAPFRSGITIEDYQLDPLVRAIDMARVNLLIADDVGLGKTIEAGLVIQEMLVRHRARSVFIVCPASLQVKWQDEMRDKFGLEFRIVDTEYVRQLRRERGIHANPWASYPRLIASMDWMKGSEGMRLLRDVLPTHSTYPRKFDILVVDEAHNVSPAAASTYAIESQRTRLIRSVSNHFEHRLFLSATPHNGYQESFTSLLELLDNQRFARTVMPNEKQLHRVMVRRLKSDIVDADGKPVYPERKLMMLEVDYSKEEKEIHRLLNEYSKSRAVSLRGSRYAYGAEFVHMLLKKRLFSSPMAFALTLAKHRNAIGSQRKTKTDTSMNERILRKAILRAEEDYENEEIAEEAQGEAVEAADNLSERLTAEQKKMLDRLTEWAESFKNKEDAKSRAILGWLEDHLKTNGEWNSNRVILFTEYRATQTMLEQLLVSHDFGGERLALIHGSVKPDDREKIKAAFQAHPDVSPVRILLATDAASEGIDLQNHCNYLIHVEIPWNPNVMEQRNGRIDRHGQKEKEVYVWHPVAKGFDANADMSEMDVGEVDGDLEYLMRAVIKVNNIREDLGSVGPVIAKQIEEAMLGKRRSIDTKSVEQKASKARKFVVAEKKLQEKVSRLHDRLMEAKNDFRLSPENIERAVKVALELAEKPTLEPVELTGVTVGKVFRVPVLPGSWGKAMTGLEHPHTGVRRPITFDHEVAKGRDDVVLAHLNHPLVQMCLRLLREELWKLDDIKKLHRVIVKRAKDGEIEQPVVAVMSRLVITGGDHNRLHEEITLSGGELKESGFSRIPQLGRLEALVDASDVVTDHSGELDALDDRFKANESSILSAVEARSRERLKTLSNTLNIRKEAEKADLKSVLEDLERNIQQELRDGKGPQQMELPGLCEDERTQIRRDVDALKVRLSQIPEEKEKELAAIDRRYENMTDYTFPFAVVFIVPGGGS